MNNLKAGLRPLPPDSRDFKLGALISLPKLSELPKTFQLTPLTIKDQLADGNEDFCSAYSTCGASEIQEGVPLYPEYSFAASKKLSGDPDKWGQDMRSAVAAHVKYGATDEPTPPLTSEERRDFDKYPEDYRTKALTHIKDSYVKVEGSYDSYDDIRATIWKFRNEKRAVMLGLVWGWDLSLYNLSKVKADGFGHMVYCIGWTEDGLLIVNSAGRNAGKDGLHCVSREVINYWVSKYGAYTFIDVPPEKIKYMLENGIKLGDNWLVGLYRTLLAIIKDFLRVK